MSAPDRTPRRDPAGATLAAILCALLGWGAYASAQAGGWWIIATTLCGLLGFITTYGLIESLQKRERDHRGIQTRPTE